MKAMDTTQSTSGAVGTPGAAARRVVGRGRRALRPATRRLVAAVPGRWRIPLRDAKQRTLLRAGRGEVVPVARYEEFLLGHLPLVGLEGGMYVEFGVYVGSSLGAAVRAFDRAGCRHARFVGFDSFAGLPTGSEAEGWTSGAFATSRAVAEWHLERQGVLDRVELVEGWFVDTCTSDTVQQRNLRDIVVAMIDCDVYSASSTALDFVGPLLADRSLVIFDDWFTLNPTGEAVEGQRKALDEFRHRHPEIGFEPLGRVGFHGLAFLATRQRATAPLRPAATVSGA